MAIKAMVTGGCGFLGSAICQSLVQSGKEVIVFDKPGADPTALLGLEIELVLGDVRDEHSVGKAVKGCDIVFHTAAMTTFWRRLNSLQFQVNVNGTKTVMEACIKHDIPKVVHTSSINAFGYLTSPEEEGTENTPYNWQKENIGYMNTKYLSEQLVSDLVKSSNLQAVIVNPGTIFGPRYTPGLGANRYIIEMAKGNIRLFPQGGTNCVGIDDVVKGHLAAAENGRIGERYILGGENLTYQELFARIAALLEVSPPSRSVPLRPALFVACFLEWMAWVLGRPPLITREMIVASNVYSFYSSSKAKLEIGYSSRPFQQVLKETVEYLEKQNLIARG